MTDVDIRPPRAVRAYVAIFLAVWCVSVAGAGIRGIRAGSTASLVTLPMLCVGAATGYRLLRLGVRTDHDRMTVRNTWSTRTLTRADVEDVRTGPWSRGGPGSRAVQVLLRDGTILPVEVTATALPLARSRARVQLRLEQLRAWHSGSGDQ